MKFAFAQSYLNSISDNEDEVVEIDPTNCSKVEFRSIMSYLAIQSMANYKELKAEISSLKRENSELKTSLNTVVEEKIVLESKVKSLESRLDISEAELREITSRVRVLENFKVNHVKRSDEGENRILQLERHSRKRNLRFIMNAPETEGEDTTVLLKDALSKVGLHPIIEHSHRTGKKVEGKPRQIIACFHNRPEMFAVMGKRNELFSRGIKVFQDLCFHDLQEKRKHSEYMQQLHDQGKRVQFNRGAWFINGVKFSGVESEVY